MSGGCKRGRQVKLSEGTTRELQPGSPAPNFILPDADGRPFPLADALRRGPVLLVFFKIACPTCQYALPFVERLAERLDGSPVTVWAVSQDSPEHTAMFNREFGISLRPLFDSEDEIFPVSEAYQIAFVPTLFVIEQDGTISRTSTGFNKKELEEIAAHLSAAAGREAAPLFAADENVPLSVPGCGGKN
jgi:peroxiredoxin